MAKILKLMSPIRTKLALIIWWWVTPMVA